MNTELKRCVPSGLKNLKICPCKSSFFVQANFALLIDFTKFKIIHASKFWYSFEKESISYTHTHTQKIMNRYKCDLFKVVVNIGKNISPDAVLIGERSVENDLNCS